MIQEGLNPCGETSLVKRPNSPVPEIQLNPTPGAASPRSRMDQDLVGVSAEFKGFDAEIHEGVWFHPFAKRRSAPNRGLAPRTQELDLGVGDLDRGIEVAPAERLIGPAQLLDVLV